jgi:hypothetical protein
MVAWRPCRIFAPKRHILMAFDAVAMGARRTGASDDGPFEALVTKIAALSKTNSLLDNLSSALGGQSDTTALRAKLQATETAAQALQNEVDGGLRKLRMSIAAGGGSSSAVAGGGAVTAEGRQLRRLEDEYAKVKEGVAAAVAGSRLKRRQFAPTEAGAGAAGEEVLAAARAASSAKRDGRDGGAAGGIMIEMGNFTDVDAAIIQERNAEALSIAKDSVALARTVQDLSELVVHQGEMLNVVEANVDAALTKTETGVGALTQASKYASSYRKKCALFWILFILAVCLITIPLVIHYVPRQAGAAAASPSPVPLR